MKDSDADFNLGFAIGYAQASASNGTARVAISDRQNQVVFASNLNSAGDARLIWSRK